MIMVAFMGLYDEYFVKMAANLQLPFFSIRAEHTWRSKFNTAIYQIRGKQEWQGSIQVLGNIMTSFG